ncbi:MAG: beta-hexosaminidase [Ruminococcus sp.]|nr:beta-hexosaminidase [Ruminococcus sp.]
MSKGKFAVISIISVILVLAVAFSSAYFFSDKSEDENSATEAQTQATEPVTEEPTQPQTETVDYTDVISQMTLEEKVAQMMMVSCHEGVDIEAACSYNVGSICLYSHSFADKTADEVSAMIGSYQELSSIPMLVSTDEEGGTVVRVSSNEQLRATPFWSPSELYNEGGFELIKSDTIEKAELLLSLGVNVNLAPVCDVPLSEENYIYDRCFSLSHEETSQYVECVVKTMKEKRIGSTLKHFPGYGGSVDTHESMSYDYREYSDFENGDFLPFIAGIETGADSVLVSHNIVTCMDENMPASLSKPIHDILRNDLGFSGVIITDDLVMQGIQQFTDGENAAVLAVKAGNDMIICEDYVSVVNAIISAVENGEINETQINDSVNRILIWKHNLGLIS